MKIAKKELVIHKFIEFTNAIGNISNYRCCGILKIPENNCVST